MVNRQLIKFSYQRCKIWHITSLCLLFIFITNYFISITPLCAADRTNVPLKNWGGFSENRSWSWVYDALEKIVLAGLADQALLNTKPLSRMEAARIVAQALRRLEHDHGDYNDRDYLEDLLYKLVQEFGPELAEMGVKTPLNHDAQPRFGEIKPIDHAQLGSAYATNSQRLINRSGQRVGEGINGDLIMNGRGHLGDFLSVYYQPEFFLDKESSQGRLQVGYAKLTFWNTELEVGRDSLWWGPGFQGSMLFSNNAPPLDQIRLSSAEPFRLPWIFEYLGPIKVIGFVGQLEKDRDLPNALVGAYRLSLAPYRYLEIGIGRAFQFGGEGRGYTIKDFPQIILNSITQKNIHGTNDIALNTNNLASFDITVRIPNVDRYIFIARDMSLYGEMGWDDTRHGFIQPKQPGGLVGTHLTGFLGDPKLDLHLEYANTTPIQFTHTIYTSGFTYKDSVISHFIGTDGNEIFGRLSRWINPDILLGFQVSRAEIGTSQSKLLGSPHEKRTSFGPDISYRISDRSSIFMEYDFSRVTNRDFVDKGPENDHLFLIEFTYSL